jgi:predicted MFS family arabinose efflux permease
MVLRLSSLFALDSFAGGFTVSAFVAYWLRARFDAPPAVIAVTFFAIGMLQTLSFLAAPRLADRVGLLRTMVFTHLPSNVLLAAVAFAPNLAIAIALLLTRTALSQMDVPTRQAYVMTLVDPDERTPAAVYTNTARYVSRPAGPPLAAFTETIALGLPFVISGGLKSAYDLTLWRWFRHVPLPDPVKEPA